MDKVLLPFVDEATFKSEEIEFIKDHVDVAQFLFDAAFNKYKHVYPNNPMVAKDKKSLFFGIDLATDRTDRELGTNLYKITITKFDPTL